MCATELSTNVGKCIMKLATALQRTRVLGMCSREYDMDSIVAKEKVMCTNGEVMCSHGEVMCNHGDVMCNHGDVMCNHGGGL